MRSIPAGWCAPGERFRKIPDRDISGEHTVGWDDPRIGEGALDTAPPQGRRVVAPLRSAAASGLAGAGAIVAAGAGVRAADASGALAIRTGAGSAAGATGGLGGFTAGTGLLAHGLSWVGGEGRRIICFGRRRPLVGGLVQGDDRPRSNLSLLLPDGGRDVATGPVPVGATLWWPPGIRPVQWMRTAERCHARSTSGPFDHPALRPGGPFGGCTRPHRR